MPQGSRFILRLFGAALAGLLLASSAAAHDDEVTLERLNRKPASAREAVELLLHRAGIMRAERRLAEAEALLDQVAALDPSSPGLARARAQVALDRDRPDATLRALDACPDTSLASDPRVPWLRADAFVRLGRLDEAARVMDQAIARFGFARPEQALERARVAEQRPDEGGAPGSWRRTRSTSSSRSAATMRRSPAWTRSSPPRRGAPRCSPAAARCWRRPDAGSKRAKRGASLWKRSSPADSPAPPTANPPPDSVPHSPNP